jgi:hypothetical protein
MGLGWQPGLEPLEGTRVTRTLFASDLAFEPTLLFAINIFAPLGASA